MRPFLASIALCATALVAIGCGSDDGSSQAVPAPADAASPAPASTTPTASPPTPEGVSVDALAAVVCDEDPVRLGADAELLTRESWRCSRAGEGIRMDLYESDSQQDEALRTVESIYVDIGDPRTLSELPLVCGDGWSIGVDFNATRDQLITELNDAGVIAGLC